MRRWILSAAFLWLTPVAAVGAGAFGLSVPLSLALGAVLAAFVATFLSRPLARALQSDGALPTWISISLGAVCLIAVLRIAALSVFMADVNRPQFSVEPDDNFRVVHSCMSAYAEAARFLDEGAHNIYERTLYRPGGQPRAIGPLRSDPFHYPPPFLLLPQAIRVVAPDFWDFRRIWFVLQAVTLAGAVVGLAGWVGGRAGAVALTGGLLVLAFPHAAATIQQGNFQITGVPLGVIAFVLLIAGREALGGGVLAYAALGKIFPGLLVIPLLTGRHWRALAWVAAMGLVILALTVATQGIQPMRDFFSTSLPEISTGAAFPQTENGPNARVNLSAYGQTVRLRMLGVTWLTQPRGLMAAQIYGVLVVALAAWAGWRRRFDLTHTHDRLAVAQLALGLVGLASYRSPFVGAVYGGVSTLWLMGVCAARARQPLRAQVWLLGLCVLAYALWSIPSPAYPPSQSWIWITGALTFACMGISVWAVLAAVRPPAPAPAPPPAPLLAIHPLP